MRGGLLVSRHVHGACGSLSCKETRSILLAEVQVRHQGRMASLQVGPIVCA